MSKLKKEMFSIPGAGAIIVKNIDGTDYILLQTRIKPKAPMENGLLEIPAGKIRAFENIFDTIKREVKEETGLDIIKICGEDMSSIYEGKTYKVVNFMPFSCAQNVTGDYPIMVFVFICYVKGDLLPFSDEARNYKWASVDEIKNMIYQKPELFYPMHIDTLRKYVNYMDKRKM